MKRGLLRTTAIGGLFIFITLLFINLVYKTKTTNTTIIDLRTEKVKQEKDEYLIKASSEEKFMSFLPHG